MQASRDQMMLPPLVSRDRVIRDRVIRDFPQCYTPESSLQLKKDWNIQVIVACNNRAARPQLWDPNKISKVVVVGDFNVGKTCILKRFCTNVFLRGYKATVGVDFETERFHIRGVPFCLQIWDTAGQERFKSVASAFYRVVVSVFDMANIKSLDHTRIWDKWKQCFPLLLNPGDDVCVDEHLAPFRSFCKFLQSTPSKLAKYKLKIWVTPDIAKLQWLQESLKENEPESFFVFLVGNKADLLYVDVAKTCHVTELKSPQTGFLNMSEFTGCKWAPQSPDCNPTEHLRDAPHQERWRTEKDAVRIAKEMNAEFWAVSAKTGENIQDFFFRVAALAFESCILKEIKSVVHAGIGPGDALRSDRGSVEEDTSPKGKKRTCCR